MWNLWYNSGGPDCTAELLDPEVPPPNEQSFRRLQICVKVGLLCVQESFQIRPNMSVVADMLRSQDMPPIDPIRPTLRNMEVGQPSGTTATDEDLT